MDEDDSSFASGVTSEPPLPTPSCSNESDDSRIRCTNEGSVREIIKVTLSKVSEFAESSVEDHADFICQFKKSFKCALLENILVNDLPLVLDGSKLTLSQTEDEKLIVDNNALSAKLCHCITKTAYKRKYYPGQCCRIMKSKMKHELQNVKRGKVIDSSTPKHFSEASKQRNHKKPFDEFCNDMKSIQEIVEYRTVKRKELEMKLSLASDTLRSQKRPSKS